jgi:FAD binding domain
MTDHSLTAQSQPHTLLFAERDRLFDGQSKLMPFFTDYQIKTKRQIPVLTLTRID